MRGASVLIALAGIAVFSLGFIKLAQNSFVDPVSVQYGNKLTRRNRSLGAGEDIDYTNVVGAKAILLKYANALLPSVSEELVKEVSGKTTFGVRKDSTRKVSFPPS